MRGDEATGRVSRVLRGGHWASTPAHARCAHREGMDPSFFHGYIGFSPGLPSEVRMLRTRAELVRVLAQASELEHALCCQYLFAAFALKTHIDEDDVTWEQLEIARGWKTTLLGIARQEMEHLAYANNLLTAIGGAPHFQRPDFPIAHRNYSIHVRMGLLPVTQVALERFICIERPESLGRDHAFCAHLRARTPTRRRNGVGAYESIGELYSKIRRAFSMMDEKRLFIGPPQAQVTTQALGLGRKGFYGMRTDPVVDRDSALAAIDQICIEGEGGPGRPTKDRARPVSLRAARRGAAPIHEGAGTLPPGRRAIRSLAAGCRQSALRSGVGDERGNAGREPAHPRGDAPLQPRLRNASAVSCAVVRLRRRGRRARRA